MRQSGTAVCDLLFKLARCERSDTDGRACEVCVCACVHTRVAEGGRYMAMIIWRVLMVAVGGLHGSWYMGGAVDFSWSTMDKHAHRLALLEAGSEPLGTGSPCTNCGTPHIAFNTGACMCPSN